MIRHGDRPQRPRGFERVYDEHHRGVYAAAFRILGNAAQAQDVVQDVFLRLWRAPAAVRRRARRARLLPAADGPLARARPLARGPGAGRAADRLKVVVARRRAARRRAPGAARRARRASARASARRSRELPEAQREALVLAYWGGLTADEIARRVDVPLGTAKSRIRLGLEKLRADAGAGFSPAHV